MILPAHMAKQAANGQATIGLVPVRTPRTVTRTNGTTYQAQPWHPTTGRHEALRASANGKTATLTSIVIGEHHTMLLAALLDEDREMFTLTRACGFKTRADLAREWMRHYDKRHDWPPRRLANCPGCDGTGVLDPEGVEAGHVEFVECPGCDMGAIYVEDTPTDAETLTRFKARHGDTLVHVVRFTLDKTEHLRLLSPAGRPRGDELGYTENPTHALEDAGEAVPAAYQAALSKEAGDRDAKLRAETIRRETAKINQSLRVIASVGDETLRTPIDAVRRRVDRLERKVPDAA